MNAVALLSLLADLYAQLQQAVGQVEQLQARIVELEAAKKEP